MDSPAYAELSFSAQSLLMVLARQMNGDNNGRLQASYKFCRRYGFGSEHTIRGAIAELIAHGLIYRTRSHGANKAWARYAVTWLPIGKLNDDGVELFLDGFKMDAWKHYVPSEKKAPCKKCRNNPAEPAVSPSEIPQEMQESPL
jgi:hypothetical protein